MAPPAELITAAARGDEEAIAAVVAEHGALVFNTCLRVLGNREEAEDAAQAAFILFLKKAKSLDSTTVLAAWLHRAAELVAREHLRAKRRRAVHEKEAAMRREIDTERDWQALRPELDAAIAQLPERYRSAIILSYLEGKTTAEAGAVLGVPQSTITTWLDRGRQKLRDILTRRGVNLSSATLVALLSSRLIESPVPATLLPGAVAAAKSLAAGTLNTTISLQVSHMLKGATKMLFWIKIKYACMALAFCLLAGVATPLAIRAASEEKRETVAPPKQEQPAPVDPAKPLDLGEIAYTGGAFTPDGKHFVYALVPKAKGAGSEIKAVEVSTGKVQSLGMIALLQKPDPNPREAPLDFKWSMGVLGAENNLATVYVAQFGPAEDLEAKNAIAWDMKKNEQVKGQALPDLAAALKERLTDPKSLKVELKDLDETAAKQRKEYVPKEKLESLVGKKQLSIEITGVSKPILPIDVTDAFKKLYAEAVAKYPASGGGPVSGKVLESDSFQALAYSRKWVLAHAGIYVHYGIWGNGYGSVLLIDTQSSRVITYPEITSYSASGVRFGPLQELYVASPDHAAIAAMSQGRLTLYRLPAE